MRWDIFCRVVDNFGDIGFCWRLAADLASRGESPRLWLDDAAALRWLAPSGAARSGVEVRAWDEADAATTPGEVVIEAFGCDPPPGFVSAMSRRPPLWINLEHLSAEAYVERCHGLPSPQSAGPGLGMTKWFFYPGFTPRTGGLLREPGLIAAQLDFDRVDWLAERGWAPHAGERVVTLFCYDNPRLADLLADLGDRPTLLLAAPGAASRAIEDWPGSDRRPLLRCIAMPWLAQTDYDRLLWSADLNFVRGEDSFVRAQWASAPMVWQIYPQDDGAHAEKLAAFLALQTATATPDLAQDIGALWRGWNGLADWPRNWPDLVGWRSMSRQWRETLLAQDDLASQLLRFVSVRL
jgi:uncharacterized repeat protein (TIGR03837 family)